MARLYPRLGNCPRCGGTGRVNDAPWSPWPHALIGDHTRICPLCLGTGQTLEEQAAGVRAILANVGGLRI
jgi:DnaJ-class molecular chaperone